MPFTQLAESSASSHAASTELLPSAMSIQPADCASTNEVASTPAPEVDEPTCHHSTHQAAMAAVICHSQYVAIFLLFCTCLQLASCPSRRSPLQHWLLPNTPICSGITPCYDKPSLKVGELSRTCQPLAQGGDKSRQTTQSHWRVLQAYVLYARTKRGFTERSRSGSKRTSWIVRATILGFIYTWEVLVSNLSRSMYSK